MSAKRKSMATVTVDQALKYISQMIARGEEPEKFLPTWESAIRQAASTGGEVDVNALIQNVLRDAYFDSGKDLQSIAEIVRFFNENKERIRHTIDQMRSYNRYIEAEILRWEEKLNSIGDDAQLANVDLQNMLQKQQQTLQTMSNISKMLNDTAMAIIRKIGG